MGFSGRIDTILNWTELNGVSWVTISRIGCTEQFTVVVHQLHAAVSMKFGKRGTISCSWRTRSKRPLVTDRPAVHFRMSYSSSPSNRHSRIALTLCGLWDVKIQELTQSRNLVSKFEMKSVGHFNPFVATNYAVLVQLPCKKSLEKWLSCLQLLLLRTLLPIKLREKPKFKQEVAQHLISWWREVTQSTT